VLLLALPCALALLIFSKALVSVLYNYGAFTAHDVQQTTVALMGYGVGLLGLVAIKVLAPGYYASQNIRTPVRIAVAVLVITQLFNVALVPYLAHAGLALSIGLGALVNAVWLLGLGQKRHLCDERGLAALCAAGAGRVCGAGRLAVVGSPTLGLDSVARHTTVARGFDGFGVGCECAGVLRHTHHHRLEAARFVAPITCVDQTKGTEPWISNLKYPPPWNTLPRWCKAMISSLC